MNILVLLLAVGMTTAQVLVSPVSRDCRELGTMREEIDVAGPVEQYAAGEVMMVKAQIPKVEGGVFEFYLCPEVDPENEECLIKLPLELAVGQGEEIDLARMSQGGLYEIPLMLPEDISCDSCTLLWELVTTQCATEGDEPCSSWRTTTCADISIVNLREQKMRGWNFVKGFFGKALGGAARRLLGKK